MTANKSQIRNPQSAIRNLFMASITVVALLALWSEPALAQCAMCKEALANSAEAAATAKQFNLAILVLLVPPVAMFFGIFGMIYRSGKKEAN